MKNRFRLFLAFWLGLTALACDGRPDVMGDDGGPGDDATDSGSGSGLSCEARALVRGTVKLVLNGYDNGRQITRSEISLEPRWGSFSLSHSRDVDPEESGCIYQATLEVSLAPADLVTSEDPPCLLRVVLFRTDGVWLAKELDLYADSFCPGIPVGYQQLYSERAQMATGLVGVPATVSDGLAELACLPEQPFGFRDVDIWLPDPNGDRTATINLGDLEIVASPSSHGSEGGGEECIPPDELPPDEQLCPRDREFTESGRCIGPDGYCSNTGLFGQSPIEPDVCERCDFDLSLDRSWAPDIFCLSAESLAELTPTVVTASTNVELNPLRPSELAVFEVRAQEGAEVSVKYRDPETLAGAILTVWSGRSKSFEVGAAESTVVTAMTDSVWIFVRNPHEKQDAVVTLDIDW